MKITFKSGDPREMETSALVVFHFSKEKPGLGNRSELKRLKQYIVPRLSAGDFKANHLDVMLLFPELIDGPERLCLVGLGPEKECNLLKVRAAVAKAAQTIRDLGLTKGAFLLPPPVKNLGSLEDVAEVTALGIRLGLYSFNELKTKDNDKKKALDEAVLIYPEAINRRVVNAALKRAEIAADAVNLARDLINRPSNRLKPQDLAQEAEKQAKEHGLKVTVIDMKEAERRKMGAFLAVAQGSHAPGRVIILEYNGSGSAKKRPLALVGKGITFDSGGISIKPPAGMEEMKTDMSGGAVVLAVMTAAARLKLKDNLIGIIPAAENMPGGGSYRPGDVVESMSGKTVEVTNTDAEGRMVLIDGLALALEYKPRAIIDLATLTGACVVALGRKMAGLLGTDPKLVSALKQAGESSGDRVWELPLFEDYMEQIKSQVADIKHVGGRDAGTITAALFLKQFVNDTPWAHLDIAGPARAEKASPDVPAGGTGYGVNLLLHYLTNN